MSYERCDCGELIRWPCPDCDKCPECCECGIEEEIYAELGGEAGGA